MAIYRLPPSPFVGGRQPLAPKDLNPAHEAVEVNDPSPRQAAVFAAILVAWSPAYAPYVPVQRQIQTPQEFVEVEHIPPPARIDIILNSWNQEIPFVQIQRKIPIVEEFVPFVRQRIDYPLDAYYPIIQRKLTPPSVDDPPFKSRPDPSIAINWITPDPIIQKYNKYIPEVIVAEQVPFRQYQPLINWQEKDYPIQIQSKIITEEIVSFVPNVRPQLYIYLEYPQPQLQRKFIHVAQDDPPFSSRTILPALIAWNIPPDPIVQKYNKYISEFIVVEEKVPFTRQLITNYVDAWTKPQTSPKFVHVDVKVPYKPYQPTWYADVIQPQLPRKLNPSLIAVQVDDPPFSSRSVISTLITWNEPPAPIIQKYNKGIFEVRADNPPPISRASIAIGNWTKTLQFIQISPKVIQAAEEFVPYSRPQLSISLKLPTRIPRSFAATISVGVVNDPPFGKRDWLNIILSNWTVLLEPPRPVLVTPRYPIEPSLVNDPPFGRRVLWLNTVMDAWIPPPPMPTNPIPGFTPPPSDDIIIWLWKRVL